MIFGILIYLREEIWFIGITRGTTFSWSSSPHQTISSPSYFYLHFHQKFCDFFFLADLLHLVLVYLVWKSLISRVVGHHLLGIPSDARFFMWYLLLAHGTQLSSSAFYAYLRVTRFRSFQFSLILGKDCADISLSLKKLCPLFHLSSTFSILFYHQDVPSTSMGDFAIVGLMAFPLGFLKRSIP